MKGIERHWYPLTDGTALAQRALAKVTKKPVPLDPLTGPKLALAGRVVTMDETFTVKPDAVVYIERGGIVAIQDRAQAPPPGFDGLAPVDCELSRETEQV
jgi:5-methylthioadenosine/S-adenosylhomocysteine deaminase